MRLTLAFVALVGAPALAADEAPREPSLAAADAGCANAKLHTVDRDQPLSAHPMNQEPGARLEIAVLHTEGGCVKPIVVGENIGAPSPAPERR